MSPARLVRIALVGLGFFAAAAVHAQTTLSVSPTIAAPGANVTATWGGIPSPSSTDWLGLYTPGAANTSYLAWRYTTGAASGNVPFTIPSGTAPGTYQLRLLANNGYSVLATSADFTVAHTVIGTVTVSSSPLSGVGFSASNGGSCGTSNASGQYTCLVPPNWTGNVTPALTGYSFSPASRSYTSVTANQTAQNYAASQLLQVSGTVTFNSSALAGVVITATNGVTCSATNASGQYGCTVPSGWSGSVTPSLGGHSFTPTSRSYTNVTTTQAAQNFTAAADPASAAILYIHVDHLNTPRLVTNQQGQARWRWDQQEPFGVNVPDENPSALGAFEFPLRFPGQYADKETNLHYNYFRDYDPTVSRYVESDPIGLAGGINTYAYVRSNPLSNIDPTGECPWCLVGAGIGATFNIASQLAQNGGNWGQIQWQQVGFAAASGLLGGGLGTATASLRLGWNVLANTAGSAGIGAGLALINNQLFPAAQQNVCTAAINAGIFGGAGALLGGTFNQAFAAYRAYQFGQLPLATRVFLGSNAISGPYLPPGTPNWAVGGTALGNLIANTVSNLNQ